MPTKTFPIQSYEVNLYREGTAQGGSVKFYAIITCKGAAGDRLHLYFLRPDSGPADNFFNTVTNISASFLPADLFPWYLDVLRHETPVTAYVNSDLPNFNGIRTGDEPVGEGGG